MYNPEALKALLDEDGVPYKQNAKSFILNCPRCRKREKLFFRKSDGRFVCWYCREIDNFQGRPEFGLVEVLRLPFIEIKVRLYGPGVVNAGEFLDVKVRDFFSDEDEVPEDTFDPPTMVYPPDFLPIDNKFSAPGADYLRGRGIDLETAKFYDLHFWPPRRRIIFPVKLQGRVIGWQDRYIGKTEWIDDEHGKIVTIPKALTVKDLRRDRCLMFGDRLNNSPHCILTEGPIDALKAHLCGGNVATMGKAVSAPQINLIRNSGIQKLYLALDPDAYRETKRLTSEFGDLELYDMRPPAPYKDLGEMTLEAVHELFLTAPKTSNSQVFVHVKNPFERYGR